MVSTAGAATTSSFVLPKQQDQMNGRAVRNHCGRSVSLKAKALTDQLLASVASVHVAIDAVVAVVPMR